MRTAWLLRRWATMASRWLSSEPSLVALHQSTPSLGDRQQAQSQLRLRATRRITKCLIQPASRALQISWVMSKMTLSCS